MLIVRATITTLKKKASAPWASYLPPQPASFDLHVRDLEGHPDDKREIHEIPIIGVMLSGKNQTPYRFIFV